MEMAEIMKSFTKIVAPTVHELFMQQMMGAILSGNIKPGEKLPAERSLAEQMGISKTAVHDGLKELEQMGFVEMKPQSGVYASDYLKKGNFDTFTAIVQYTNDPLSFELIQSFADILLAVNNRAYHLFVEKPGDKRHEIHKLDHLVEEIGIALADPGLPVMEKARTIEQFQYQLGVYSGSPAFPFMMNVMDSPAEVVWESCVNTSHPEEVINVADGIVRALEAGDAEKAYTLLENATNQFLEEIQS